MDRDKRKDRDTLRATSGVTRRDFLATFGAGAALLRTGAPWSHRMAPPVPSAGSVWHYESLSSMARLIERRDVSPVEVTRQLLDRIAALDGRLHSYVTVTEDRAMASAKNAETEIQAGRHRGPLHGIPIGIKDLCYTRGVPTMGGTKVFADLVPDFDATVVARLNAAGAVTLGKLTLCEGAMAPYHPELEVPVNPWDATRWTGVSSSGSGVATAAGLCFASIGTDTGGSIRYPSAANGCVGLKPTYGRVSRYGVIPLAESMDHVGSMARTVEDAVILFEAMAGFDPNDPTSLAAPMESFRAELSVGIAGLRIGFDRGYATDGVEPELVKALDVVLAELTALGAEIVEVAMPDVRQIGDAWWDLATAEAAAFHAATYPSRAEKYGPGFRDVLEYGRSVSGVAYANAAKVRAELTGRLHRTLARVDCMVCPSMSNQARPKLVDPFHSDDSWGDLVLRDVHTKPFNFSGSPTLSLPCGFSSDGLPFSVQFVGRSLGEATICRVGYAYEQATEWHDKHPAL